MAILHLEAEINILFERFYFNLFQMSFALRNPSRSQEETAGTANVENNLSGSLSVEDVIDFEAANSVEAETYIRNCDSVPETVPRLRSPSPRFSDTNSSIHCLPSEQILYITQIFVIILLDICCLLKLTLKCYRKTHMR